MRFARVECATSRRESHCKKALSSRAACGIVAVEAMSEFKFACPVCGQHITADSSTSGGQIECPTCFRKIVVPQAPASQDTKLILSAAQVGKPRPSSAEAISQLSPLQTAAPRSSLPAVLALLVFLCAAGAALFVFRDRIFRSAGAPAPAGTNALPQPATVALNTNYPVPTNITWTLDLTNAMFPETIAAGSIHGSGFLCEKAILQGGRLSLIQGKTSPSDLAIAVNLIARQGEELSGKTVQIAADRPRARPVVLRWKDARQKPVAETISGGYALKLVFGEATNGRMPGKIFICLPDSSKSFVAGTFDAEIRKALPPKPRPPKAPRPKG
jgi:DNA-directed RNA polymerase subunit RPC12/RpoP